MYIDSFCSISALGVIVNEIPPEIEERLSENAGAPPTGNGLSQEPDYSGLIPPMQLRRMSRGLKTGVAAAKLCLKAAGDVLPSSIHTGTAYGMLQDSENFLSQMLQHNEQRLSPTAFIQSTHNTVSGQIALLLGCVGHNLTFVQNGHSFESALMDAALHLSQKPDVPVLAGAVDEWTPALQKIVHLFDETAQPGEATVFLCLCKNSSRQSIARIQAYELFSTAKTEDASAAISRFLTAQRPQQTDVPFIVVNGTALPTGDLLSQNTLGSVEIAYSYLRHTGSFPTASATGLAFAASLVKHRQKNALLVHNSGKYWSLYWITVAA